MVFNKLFSLFPHNNSHTSLNLKNIQQNKDKSSVIFLGPWMGEVGPEILYWIPYIRKLKETGKLAYKKIIALSRGGVQSWYADITQDYIELFNYIDLKEFNAIRNESISQGKKKKQIIFVSREKQLINKIAKVQRIKDYIVFHPSIMWADMLKWTREQITLTQALEKLSFKSFKVADNTSKKIVDRQNLPDRFIVLKFYSNPLFPRNKKNDAFVKNIINLITQKYTLIDLSILQQIDDHQKFIIKKSKRIINLSKQLNPRTNLGVQTEIIKRAEYYIGTSGGFSLLPLSLNIPVISFYSEPIGERIQNVYQHETLITKFNEILQNTSYSVLNRDTWKTYTEVFR